MSGPKAQFQVDHGSGWKTIAEVDIINGVVKPPNAWTMVRALGKRIVYTGSLPVEVTTVSPDPRDTHFADFAKTVEKKLHEEHLLDLLHRETVFDASDAVIQILARAAYDLAMHVLETSGMPEGFAEGFIRNIPDLAELPLED